LLSSKLLKLDEELSDFIPFTLSLSIIKEKCCELHDAALQD
jgi:hypothetical protein